VHDNKYQGNLAIAEIISYPDVFDTVEWNGNMVALLGQTSARQRLPRYAGAVRPGEGLDAVDCGHGKTNSFITKEMRHKVLHM
jgi:hypothetical protein